METIPSPRISRATRVPLIWFVPLLAAVIAGWMILRQWHEHGPEILIEFKDGTGLEVGKTRLDHKGVVVGVVTAVEMKGDLSGVTVHLRLERSASQLARAGARFWIVYPEIGLSGISGLDTLLNGVRLNVHPGSGAPATSFRGLDRAPAPENATDGRAFLLATDRLGTLVPGAPVLYRDIKVGEVESRRLSDDASGVIVRIRIFTPYVDLVRTNSQFWQGGGVPLRFSLFGGAQVDTRSIGTFVTGAVAFATPTDLAAVATDGTEFNLHGQAEKDWLKWAPKIPIQPGDDTSIERAPLKDGAAGVLKP